MSLAWSLLAAATPPALGTPAPAPRQVEITDSIVRLSDVADLSDLRPDLRARAAATPILALRPGAMATLTPEQIGAYGRRRMPLLAQWRPGETTKVVVRRAAPTPAVASTPVACVRPRRAIDPDRVLTGEDFADVDCGTVSAPRAAWRYDRAARALRADRALATTDVLSAPPATMLAAVRPGQNVRVTARIGAVTIERAAEAVQPARAGQPLFVKAGGRIFAVPAVEQDQ